MGNLVEVTVAYVNACTSPKASSKYIATYYLQIDKKSTRIVDGEEIEFLKPVTHTLKEGINTELTPESVMQIDLDDYDLRKKVEEYTAKDGTQKERTVLWIAETI